VGHQRNDKGVGATAPRTRGEYEYGVTSRSRHTGAQGQSIHTSGILIDGYIPGDMSYGCAHPHEAMLSTCS